MKHRITALLTLLCLRKTWPDDKWYHPLYRRFGFVRRLVWKLAGRGTLDAKKYYANLIKKMRKNEKLFL